MPERHVRMRPHPGTPTKWFARDAITLYIAQRLVALNGVVPKKQTQHQQRGQHLSAFSQSDENPVPLQESQPRAEGEEAEIGTTTKCDDDSKHANGQNFRMPSRATQEYKYRHETK